MGGGPVTNNSPRDTKNMASSNSNLSHNRLRRKTWTLIWICISFLSCAVIFKISSHISAKGQPKEEIPLESKEAETFIGERKEIQLESKEAETSVGEKIQIHIPVQEYQHVKDSKQEVQSSEKNVSDLSVENTSTVLSPFMQSLENFLKVNISSIDAKKIIQDTINEASSLTQKAMANFNISLNQSISTVALSSGLGLAGNLIAIFFAPPPPPSLVFIAFLNNTQVLRSEFLICQAYRTMFC
jgi:hypothetical protein